MSLSTPYRGNELHARARSGRRLRIAGWGLQAMLLLGGAAAMQTAFAGVLPTYATETRTLVSGGANRSYLLAVPTPLPADAPLVIALHGDGGNSAGIRAALPMEAAAAGKAIFAYPQSSGGAFQYWDDAGRAAEATFIHGLIAALEAEFGIDTGRVYLAGFSGGATMVNALACRLGSGVIRKLGIHSGTLYPVPGGGGQNDFGYTGNGGVTCDLPGAMLIWGTADATNDTQYANGIGTRDNHRATQFCDANGTPVPGHAPCVSYGGCDQPVQWCAIEGMGHTVWPEAAAAFWDFFDADASGGPVDPPPAVYADGFEGDSAVASGRWVAGYYVGYERSLLPVADIDFSAITHLMVGRMTPNADGTLTRHFDIDTVQGPAFAHAAVAAAHDAGRKAVLMIGGAGEIGGWRAAADDATRATFVANLLAAADEFDADGIDLDWEPLDPQDYDDFIALAQALRTARPGLVLTLPLGWVNSNLEWNPRPVGEPAFLQTIAPLLDQINLMTYEMGVPYDGWHSWFASPVYGHAPNTPSSIESSVDYFLGAGVPAAKLGVGIGFYGNCMRGVTQPRVPVTNAQYAASDGAMSYRNIVTQYMPSMQAHYDATAQAPWLGAAIAAGPSQCNFVSFEDPASIAAKGAFVRDRELGGAIIWTIGQGHLPNRPVGERDPLLDAARAAFLD